MHIFCNNYFLNSLFQKFLNNISVFVSIQEALRYFNQTTKLRELLEFAQNYLQTDDEVNPKCVI